MSFDSVKILQICSYYLGSKLYQNLFNAIEKSGVKEDIYIFTDRKNKSKTENLPNTHIAKCYNRFDRLIFRIKHGKALRYILKETNYIRKNNLVHAHSLFSNGYLAYKLNQKFNLPYIVAVRNTDVNLFFKRMIHLRGLGLKILHNAELIIFISPVYRDFVINQYVHEKKKRIVSRKSVVIPNGIDRFWLNNKYIRSRKIKDKKINLIYAGNVSKNKNIETTIKACRLLIIEGYDVHYKIIGAMTNIRYRILINGYSFIEYIPFCNKEELIDHYRDSDIFIMPSIHETFGLVYAEAMSQGLPVIYTKGQGFDGQFKEGEVGYHVNPLDPEDIAQKIKMTAENYLKISNDCTTKSGRFDWDLIAGEYVDIYRSIISANAERVYDNK